MTPAPAAFSPDAVLFDCDGTLLLTADLHYAAMAEAAGRQGAILPRDWYMAITGLGRHDTWLQLAADFGLTLDIPRLTADSVALTVALAPQAQPNPAVAALALGLSGRLPLAVVTNSEAVIARAFLQASGLAPLFDAIVTVEDAPRPKPAPDLYHTAAARLAVTASRCLVLEDSAQGLAAGRASGAICLDVRDPGWRDMADCMTGLAGLAPG